MNHTEITNLREELSYYLQYIPTEKLEELQILPNDSKETCIYKMLVILREFSVEDFIPYKYIATNFDLIPKKFRLEILLKVFAQFFFTTPGLVINLFHKHMKEETEKEKEERIKINTAVFSNVIRKDGTIRCYRKVSMGDVSPIWSFAFNTNLQEVEDSLYYTDGNTRIRMAGYYRRDIHIEDVLFCGDNHEIYLIPEEYTIDRDLNEYPYSYTIEELHLDPSEFEYVAGGFFEDFNLL